MSRQNPWLFESLSDRIPEYYANPEYETALKQDWETLSGNAYRFPLIEAEWEVSPTRRPVSRTRQPSGRPPQPVGRSARIPQKRPTRPRRQQQRAPIAQRRAGQPAYSSQGQKAEANRTLIATIDRFEFGSYLLKKHQFEQLYNLILLLEDSEKSSKPYLYFRGHTDNVGGASESNGLLSARRAMEVESFIRRRFNDLPLPSPSLGGYGPTKPIAPNTTKDGQARNRRVEVFSVIPEPGWNS